MNEVHPVEIDLYCDTLDSTEFDRCEMYPQIASLQQAPAFMLGSISSPLSMAMLGELFTGSIRLYRLNGGQVTVQGFALHNGTPLISVLHNFDMFYVERIMPLIRNACKALPIRQVSARAMTLTGPGYSIYGHWLIDILPRLWVARQFGYDIDSLSFIVPAQAPPFVYDVIAEFGIGDHQLIHYDENAEILEVDELIMPVSLRRGTRIHPCIKDARDFLLSRRRPSETSLSAVTSERLFVSRRNFDASRNLQNRDKIEKMAMDVGFSSVFPEELSVAQQIELFSHARQIMGEYGSGLHNSMFSPAKTMVCALRGTSYHPEFLQSAICDAFDQPIGYVFGESPLDQIHHTFSIEEALVEAALKIIALPRFNG